MGKVNYYLILALFVACMAVLGAGMYVESQSTVEPVRGAANSFKAIGKDATEPVNIEASLNAGGLQIDEGHVKRASYQSSVEVLKHATN